MRKADIESAVQDLRADAEFMEGVSHWLEVPEREGVYRELPQGLSPFLRVGLSARGITRLYSHQAQAYETIRCGKSTVIVTPTASGKTLCYNLPVLQGIIERPETRALYLFPTKALSQDQQSELNEVVQGLSGDRTGGADTPGTDARGTGGSDARGARNSGGPRIKVATYDGDTPNSIRAAARSTGQIVISNPDMLHSGILPNHPKWIQFLRNLRYVVIDEVHQYQGVFGSHTANLIRRLRRICRFYGSDPVFICCSATIGNPRELAQEVVGLPMQLIDQSGAPQGRKHMILYNPPLVDKVQGIRRGIPAESRRLALRLLTRGIKTIVFARSRIYAELIAGYLNKSLHNMYTDNQGIRVEAYRGGYLPNERRSIERGLREGTVHGVVSTNALELGIDIGGLDATILGGYPGSIASMWQQAGRSGRSSTTAVSILVAGSAPLDQYVMQHPDFCLAQNPEHGYIDPQNPYIRSDHIKCAAFELPLQADDVFFPDAQEFGEVLTETGVLRFTAGRYYWADRSYPAEGISLRSAVSDNVVIIDRTKGQHQVIGEMDRVSAKEMLFPKAIYLHRGEQYQVEELDLENRRCYVTISTVEYFTDALTKRRLQVLEEFERYEIPGGEARLTDILVRSQAAKYKKIRFHTHENVGYGEIALPEEEMHTRAAVFLFGPDTAAGRALSRIAPESQPGVIARLGWLLRGVAPLYLLCRSGDIGSAERMRDPHFGVPALYLFDRYPGGTGLAEAVAAGAGVVLSAARDRVENCSCEQGCPSCIGVRDESEEVDPDPRAAMRRFLADWLSGQAEDSHGSG
ncbi:MAG: DEAD/DEAH box helicase [Spirochaeta sp.]